MKYNLANNAECEKAFEYLTKLAGKEKVVEVKEVRRGRTLPQNAYLHLLCTAFGMQTGYTLEESKQLYKRVNKSLYYYSKDVKGKEISFARSSADLSKEEFAKSIDTFMKWSAEAGYPLPPAVNEEWLRSIENEAERSQFV